MPVELKIKFRDFFLAPNLMSLLRVALTAPLAYCLALNTKTGTSIAAGILLAAGITDFLDGFLARKLNQISALGHILDPVADKLLAIILIIELIIFRDFPIWLAAAVLLRDLVIMLVGLKIVKRRHEIVASNLSGKYYFASLAVLLGAYILRFDFGISIFLWVVILFYCMSVINYGRVMAAEMRGTPIPLFKDKVLYKLGRMLFVVTVLSVFLYRLYVDVVAGYF